MRKCTVKFYKNGKKVKPFPLTIDGWIKNIKTNEYTHLVIVSEPKNDKN